MKTKTYALRLFLAAILALALCGPVSADPAPFGLAIGKMTVDEFKKKYVAYSNGISKYSMGPAFFVDTAKSNIHFDGLQELTAIFGKDGKLMAVFAILKGPRFTAIADSLREKYQIVMSNHMKIKLKDGDTIIELTDDNPLPLHMFLTYQHRKFIDRVEETKRKEREEKLRQIKSQL